MSDKKTLLIIDSHALIYRAYYAFPPNLTNTKGEPTNAVYGFASLLMDVLLKFSPTHVVAVFDSSGPTVRQETYTQYKANRNQADELFVQQLPKVYKLLETFNIPMLMISSIEADDLIGTIDRRHSGDWAETIIVTGDRDLFQLVDNDTFVYLAGSSFSQSKLFNEKGVKEKMGVNPKQIADYKGLAGDASDNIPGVKGIGLKGTVELLNEFNTLENIYLNIEKVNKRYKQKLIDDYENAILSKNLATIDCDIPISFDFNKSVFKIKEKDKIKDFFQEMQFKSLTSKLEVILKKFEQLPQDDKFSLFDNIETLIQDPKEQDTIIWNGQNIENNEIYFLCEYDFIDKSPIHWKIRNLYFITSNKDQVFKVEYINISKFLTRIKPTLLVTFDKKKFIHSLLNDSIVFKDVSIIYDIGIASVILAEGKATFNIKSIFNFLNLKSDGLIEKDLLKLPTVFSLLKEKLTDLVGIVKLIELENDVLSTTIQMERNGITLDSPMLIRFEQNLKFQLENLQKDIFKETGHEFNIKSPKQVSEILFKEKLLPINKKTKGGAYSTDEITLRKLIDFDPIIPYILKFREIDKLITTYVSALPSYVDKDVKIHSIFDQFGAVSGRFSSKNPNLQNIPLVAVHNVNIRDSFIAAEKSIFISFDFSQQELRILAALALEQKMVDSFNNNIDIHKVTASEMFEIPIEQVSNEQRQVGKTINFSVIYGISAYGLSERMRIDRKTADEFIKKYFNKYKNVEMYLKDSINKSKEAGYAETVLGRRRSNEMLFSNNRAVRGAAERELFNFVIQGSAADIMKLAMSKFELILANYPAKLLLQIHDEFLFEYSFEENNTNILNLSNYHEELYKDLKFNNFIKEIYNNMINAFNIGVIYKVDVSVGKRWGSMDEYELNLN